MRNGVIIFIVVILAQDILAASLANDKGQAMIDIQKTSEQLKDHIKTLTLEIGERSVFLPGNLQKTADYIESFYKSNGISVHREPYVYDDFTVTNIVASISSSPQPGKYLLIGAHYDSVMGTVGADDNASAIAVQLETARYLKAILGNILVCTYFVKCQK